ncbi:MAG: carboxypeptidase-like regulatory domain-containing protein, partial [Actinomycetes bacterium]
MSNAVRVKLLRGLGIATVVALAAMPMTEAAAQAAESGPDPTQAASSPSTSPAPGALGAPNTTAIPASPTPASSTPSATPGATPATPTAPPTPSAAPADEFVRSTGRAPSLTVSRGSGYGGYDVVDPVGGWGIITGTVSGPGGAALTAGTSGTISIYGPNGSYRYGTFGSDGSFGVTNLDTGDYQLRFYADTGNYEPGWWLNSSANANTQATAAVIHVVRGSTTTNINPRLVVGGAITGTVRGPGGADLLPDTYGYVEAYDDAGHYAAEAEFDATGVYWLNGLDTGNYKLNFTASVSGGGSYSGTWWNNATTQAAATAVHVVHGSAATIINPQLAMAGSITGTVTGPGASPLPTGASVTVAAYNAAGNVVASNSLYGQGAYTLGGLPSGDYKIRFEGNYYDPAAGEQAYSPIWWNGASSRATATIVHVTAGATTPDISPSLPAYTAGTGSITGTVAGPDGGTLLPGTNGSVTVYSESGAQSSYAWFGQAGTYTISNLPTGDYRLSFNTWSGGYLGSWWQNAADQASATWVHVTNGATTADISPRLALGGTITGTVTMPDGSTVPMDTNVYVEAYNSDGSFTSSFPSWSGSSYTLQGLRAGSYRLHFTARESFGPTPVATSWWRDAQTLDTATPVTVTAGGTVANISPHLMAYGSISGTVRGPGDTKLATGTTGHVYAYVNGDDWWDISASFGDDGVYSLPGLSAGSYQLKFVTDSGPYSATWWQHSAEQMSATAIGVTLGAATQNINPQLLAAGAITGTISEGGGPLQPSTDGTVTAYNSAGDEVGSANFSDDGTYWITGLDTGDYTLQFSASAPYAPSWWSNSATKQGATTVSVVSGNTSTADQQLTIGGTITGTVAGPLPAGSHGTVSVYDGSGAKVSNASFPDSGSYSIASLATGDYTLKFVVWSAADEQY